MSKLLVETNEGIRTLVLNRPETKNAFDAELWGLFRDALNSASDDPDIYSVVVTGSSNTFSSGVDLSSMMGDGGANTKSPLKHALMHWLISKSL